MGVKEHFGEAGLRLIDRIVRSSIRRRWKEASSSLDELKELVRSRISEDEQWYQGALMAVQGLVTSMKEDSKSIFRKALNMNPEEIDRNIVSLRGLMEGSVVRSGYDEGYMETAIYILESIKKVKMEHL